MSTGLSNAMAQVQVEPHFNNLVGLYTQALAVPHLLRARLSLLALMTTLIAWLTISTTFHGVKLSFFSDYLLDFLFLMLNRDKKDTQWHHTGSVL